LTIGGRVEGESRRVSGGPVVNLRLPRGEVEAALGLSRGEARTGAAAQGSFIYADRRISAGATMRLTSPHYATLSMHPLDPRALGDVSVFTSVPAGVVSLTVQHTQAFGRDATHHRTSILGSSRLGRSLDLVSSIAHVSRQAYRSVEASVGVTLSFGGGSVASASVVRGDNGVQAVLDVQRPLPVGTGFGYQLRAAAGDRGDIDGAVQYQGDFGRYEVRREIVGVAPQTTVNVSGGVVAIGGRLHATRAVRNSFALVRVPGVAGVRAYSNHQEIGRTNGRGEVLVPELLPYYGNPLTIADTDVPLDYEVPKLRVTLAPGYRAGAVVLFPVRRIQQIVGSIVLVGNGRRQVPAYGEVTVTVGAESHVSPLGTNGDFYFENIPPGRYPAVVGHDGRSCSLMLEVKATEQPSQALGTIECGLTEAPQ
jgi:outer membrane usher protein